MVNLSRRPIWAFLAFSLVLAPAFAAQQVELPTDRTVLPIPEPHREHCSTVDVRKATLPARFELKAPAGAPNVLIVLLDDMGFGQPSAFGGPINMPTLTKLAQEGLKYNDFHTTALCSPSRAALLTGRNHHTCNMGSITEIATGFPGQTAVRPLSVAPLAEILRLNGYSTAAFGKSHETPVWEVSVSGATDRWPTRSGFDKFYGFIGGEANQWSPTIYDGLAQTEVPKDPNYHFLTDMTTRAVQWVTAQKAMTPDKPFFIYFAPGATHAPHHVPKEWIDKYKGKFDQGWDKLREQTLDRQKALGVVPPSTQLARKPDGIKDWDSLSSDEKKLFSHQMEVFAGYGEFADHEVGRLIDSIGSIGQMDNTLVFFIAGDNGASAEGGFNGLFNEMSYFNGVHENVEDILKHYDELGGPNSYGHYAAGWAVAGDTPHTWTKQIASDYGGTRNGIVVHWPKGFSSRGEVRTQFQHIIDIAPTVLEAAGLPQPELVNGIKQTPIEGVSMLSTFTSPNEKSKHTTQYFEIFGNRAIYHDGWLAGTVHKAPWEYVPKAPLADDKWELYDTTKDFSLKDDLSAKMPDKLKEMQDLFLKEAASHHVLPLDDRTLERISAVSAGRPDLLNGRTKLTVYDGMTGMLENIFISTKNKSFEIETSLEIPKTGAEGVIVAQAGKFGGWSLYLKDSKPCYTYNWLGLSQYTIASPQAVPSGKVDLRFQFDYDGGGLGKGGTGRILINGTKVAEGRIDKTESNLFSADEGADVGDDLATPVTDNYPSRTRFSGKIKFVTVSVKPQTSNEKAQTEQSLQDSRIKKALSD